jgi:NTP pyrophosphatase (non-canonical NTP hydrolase)
MRTTEILRWAKDRGILEHSNMSAQLSKLHEEVTELSEAVHWNDYPEIKDGIGDCVVVLTILADLAGTSIETCVEQAWQEIKDRKGHMTADGLFQKE